jgi:hypothetical protein
MWLIFCHLVELGRGCGQSSRANQSPSIPYVIDNKHTYQSDPAELLGSGLASALTVTEGGSLSFQRAVAGIN